MARKTATNAQDQPIPAAPDPTRDSTSQIWLAGLGAFAKAQEEGTRMFDALVREGTAIQRRTQAASEETLSEAAQRIASMAGQISSRATGQWDRLEMLFEDRVSRALQRLGVAKATDLAELAQRLDALELRQGRRRAAPGKPAPSPAPTARKRTGAGPSTPRKKAPQR